MSNTTKNNVLLIAPELSAKVVNTPLAVLFSIVTVEDSTVYFIAVNGTQYSYTSGVGATALEIISGLYDAMLSTLVTKLNNGNGTLLLTAANPPITFSYAYHANISVTVVQESYPGDDLFNLILADVILVCPEDVFSTEQERAQRYLIAHILTVSADESSAAPLNSARWDIVGDVQYRTGASMIMATPDQNIFSSTKYGEIYWDIYKRHYFTFL
jgi:hypothetical protein